MHKQLAAANQVALAIVSLAVNLVALAAVNPAVAAAAKQEAAARRKVVVNPGVARHRAAQVKQAVQQEAVNPAVLAKLAQAALLQKLAETVEHVVAPTLAQPVADGVAALAAVRLGRVIVAAAHQPAAAAAHQLAAPVHQLPALQHPKRQSISVTAVFTCMKSFELRFGSMFSGLYLYLSSLV